MPLRYDRGLTTKRDWKISNFSVTCLWFEDMFCYAFSNLCECTKQQPNNFILTFFFFTKIPCSPFHICIHHRGFFFHLPRSRVKKSEVGAWRQNLIEKFHLVIWVCHKLLDLGFFSIRLKSQTEHYLQITEFENIWSLNKKKWYYSVRLKSNST